MHAPLSPTLRVEWRAISGLRADRREWRALAARALEPNVFYDPAFALAAAPVFGEGCGAVLVWTTGGTLMGLFPARIDGLRKARCRCWPAGPIPMRRSARRWSIATRHRAVIAAWLEHLAHDPAMPALLLLPMRAGNTAPSHARSKPCCRASDCRSAAFGRHHRALLERGSNAGRSDRVAAPAQGIARPAPPA